MKLKPNIFVILIASSMLILVVLLLTTTGTHEKELALTFQDDFVIPVQANNKDGTKFSGKAYGTFFGDKTFDCPEWEGRYLNSVPVGDFKLYSKCNILESTWYFNNGKFSKR